MMHVGKLHDVKDARGFETWDSTGRHSEKSSDQVTEKECAETIAARGAP